MLAVQSLPDLIHGVGTDGVNYTIRPFEWTMEKAEKYHKEFLRYKIISDDVPKDLTGFLTTMIGSNTMWFEAVNDRGDNIGFLYLTDFMPSLTEKRFLSATFHAVTWDAKASPRLGLAKDFIRSIFKVFRLHRLSAAIPLKQGGAIRMAKRMGFKEEGIMRQSVRYNGVWFNVLLLSILESEVENGFKPTED